MVALFDPVLIGGLGCLLLLICPFVIFTYANPDQIHEHWICYQREKEKKKRKKVFFSCNYKPDWTQLSVRFSILRAFACIILCVYRSAAPYVVVNHTLITYPRSLLTNVSVWLSSICLLFSETTSPDSSKRSLCSEKLRSDLWECLWKYFWYLALRLLCLVTGLRSTLRRTRRLCAHVEFSCRGDSWLRSVFQ